MSKDIILSAQNLSKTFADGKLHVEVFRKINLQINHGEMIAVIGASGEGKSSLLYLLGGLDEPTSGHVTVCGENLTNCSKVRQGIIRNKYLGFVYQFHHLLPEFDVLENVCMPLLIRKMTFKEAKPKALALLDRVGMTHRLKHRIGEISGGERQRVALARALVTDPVCVLADEPTGNLDHKTSQQVYDLIIDLNKDLKTSFLVVTHDQNLASKMHRQLVLSNLELRPKEA